MTNKDKPLQQTNTKRIGIFGGTFDPIHDGHIKPALQVFDALALDRILVMPAHFPPHKSLTHASPSQRLAMVKLACAPYPQLTPDNRELCRSTPSYTVDTLKELKHETPDATLYFMMGMDSLLNFTKWYQWQNILKLCHLVVTTRPNFELTQLPHTLSADIQARFCNTKDDLIKYDYGKIMLHQGIAIDASSTEIRASLKKHKKPSNLVPNAVLQYIHEHKLYSV